MKKKPGSKAAGVYFFILIPLFLSGCAGLDYRIAHVAFEDPSARLRVVAVEPNAEEQAGVLLRSLAPSGNILKTREDVTTYARIQEQRGMEIRFIQFRTDVYHPGDRADTFLLESNTSFQGQKGSLQEEIEVSRRGEIIRLIRGFHESKAGKFRITSWTRTPVFPESRVKIGDSWSYEETMTMEIDSFWVKQKDPTPYKIEAVSQLTGFAEVNGRRCAIVETEAQQIRTERFKVLFKDITLYTQTTIRETTYLDYQAGLVVGRIVKMQSFTNSPDADLNDQSLSQSVLTLI